MTYFKFWGPQFIAGMAEASAVKFGTQGGRLSSHAKEMINLPQMGSGWAHVTQFACTIVDLKYFVMACR